MNLANEAHKEKRRVSLQPSNLVYDRSRIRSAFIRIHPSFYECGKRGFSQSSVAVLIGDNWLL